MQQKLKQVAFKMCLLNTCMSSIWEGDYMYMMHIYICPEACPLLQGGCLVSHRKLSYFTLGKVAFPLCSVNILIFQSLLEDIKGKRNEGLQIFHLLRA